MLRASHICKEAESKDNASWSESFSTEAASDPYLSREVSSVGRKSSRTRRGLDTYRCITSIPTCNDRVISFATVGDLLYVGSESGTIQTIQKRNADLLEFSRCRSSNAGVKAFAVAGDKVYTAHHDKKIRIWSLRTRSSSSGISDRKRTSLLCYPKTSRQPFSLKLSTTLPTVKDSLQRSLNSKNYSVQVRRHKRSLWITHVDAVTALAVDKEEQLLYSGSWDKTVKVWRLSDFKCIDSIKAHDDAVNAVVTATHGMLFTGSGDGSVKVWRSSFAAKGRISKRKSVKHRHQLITTLKPRHEMRSSSPAAVTALGLSQDECILYSGTSTGAINYWGIDKDNYSSVQIRYKNSLCGHKGSVLCLTTVRNMVISGSADKTLRVWSREASGSDCGNINAPHTCLAILEGHNGPINCIAAAPNSLYDSQSSPSSNTTSNPSSSFSSSSSSSHQYSCYDDDDENNYDDGLLVSSGSLDGSLKMWWISTP